MARLDRNNTRVKKTSNSIKHLLLLNIIISTLAVIPNYEKYIQFYYIILEILSQ